MIGLRIEKTFWHDDANLAAGCNPIEATLKEEHFRGYTFFGAFSCSIFPFAFSPLDTTRIVVEDPTICDSPFADTSERRICKNDSRLSAPSTRAHVVIEFV